MSQMMQQTIRNEDFYTLQHIVQEADRKYLKESRINKYPLNSNLNILRILSSFKELFPSTPERIYKILMMITKNHNPQTRDQWIRAINKLESMEIKNSRSQIGLTEQDSEIRSRSFSQIHKLKTSNYENSIKTYKQDLDHQVDSIVSKRSKANFVADFRTTEAFFNPHDENKENNMLMSNKNSLRNSHKAHYISFEPYHRDSIKQSSQLPQYLPREIDYMTKQSPQMSKKINPYHEITRIDNLSRIQDVQPSSKDDSKTIYSQNHRTQQSSYRCIPSKTQRNFSQTRFIRLDSKDSQISIKKSQLIRNSKSQQISQYEFYNMTIDQWENLNQKAITFYTFNQKLKAFSALIANYQAFQHDRLLKQKVKIFNLSYLQSKVFLALKANLLFQHQIKQKFNKAEKFCNQNQYKKVWKILQVMRNLKIQKQQKHFQIQKLNKTNYDFFMTFMFAQKSNFQDSPYKYYGFNQIESLQFNSKVEYFSRTQNFENVWDIYKCFGLNINISKEKLTEFFYRYHQCIARQSFSALKNYYQSQKQKYLKLHEKRLIQKVFSILLSKKEISKDLERKLFQAQTHANKKLKQKTYKILLSIVYSTKIFSKRQEFIESQKMNRTKINIFKKWLSSYQKNQNHRKIQQTSLNKLQNIYQQFILKKSFLKLRFQLSQISQKAAQVQKTLQKSNKQQTFNQLKRLLSNKKNFLRIFSKNQVNLQKNFVKKWLKLVKSKQSLVKIQKIYKKIVFRNLFVPVALDIKQDYLMNLEAQNKLMKQCFDNWKLTKERNSQKLKNLQNQFNLYLFQKDSSFFINSLKINRKQNLIIRQKQQLNIKKENLQIKLINQRKQYFLKCIKNFAQESFNQKDKIRLLNNNLKSNTLNEILNGYGQSKQVAQNQHKLKIHLKSQNFRTFYLQLHRNQLYTRQNKLSVKIQTKIFSNFLDQVSSKFKSLKEISQKSEAHFKNVTQRKVLLILANLFIDSTQKSHKLQKILNKQRRIKFFEIFKQKTKSLLQQKQKINKIQKRQIFVSLRENLNLNNRKKQLQANLDSNKIKDTFQSLIQNIIISNQTKNFDELTERFKKKQFWMRFNENFIESLFQKKHLFMAYKFRALKLYGVAFKTWKESTQSLKEIKNRQRKTKSLEKQKFFNHTQKQFKHMYRPTDCSFLSK